MPLEDEPLTADDVAMLKQWIDDGATGPAETEEASLRRTSSHWAFQPVLRPAVPRVTTPFDNPIDAFIRARLSQQSLAPSPPADKETLLRRVTLDLTGLLPSPSQVDSFLADTRPDAYERRVDELLQSPHYGERWGRHWLDLARYADSNGFNFDRPREMWAYRDWVINALNADMPYDQFAIEQLAGDLLPNTEIPQQIATGFHRNTQFNDESGVDQEQYRIESVYDRVETTASVFLGLTFTCARCHDHKYDPISQREYYQFFAFFNNCTEPKLEIATDDELALRQQVKQRRKIIEQKIAARKKEIAGELDRWLAGLDDAARAKLPAAAISPGKRTAKQTAALAVAHAAQDKPILQLQQQLAAEKEPKFETSLVLQELPEPRKTVVHLGGDFTRPGVAVQPEVPEVLPPLETATSQPSRLDLARWIVDPRNPLTPRVTMNRLWQRYFGRGLCATENDFGTQGEPATHPQLLDWLASELVASDWSLKRMHRLMVTSATYRQSSHAREDLTAADPYNYLWGRQARLRLDAEVVRDVALDASGLLSHTIGGPSVFPPQPDGVMVLGRNSGRKWVTSQGEDRYRRGMYTFFWRTTPHPMLMAFDGPESTTTCTQRTRSNTPIQALTLLNDEAFFECAQAFAGRLLQAEVESDSARVQLAFRICLSRAPSDAELAKLQQFLTQRGATTGTDEKQLAESRLRAWTILARAMLNLDEFITRE